MQYYAFELDDEAKDLCTIVTPFGKYKYNCLPMKISPDVAQSIMEDILKELDIEIYIDDVGIFSKTYEDHLKVIDQVL